LKIRNTLTLGAAAIALAGALTFAACGSDDGGDSSGGSSVSAGSGSDEDYVAGLCKAMVNFQEAVDNVDEKDVKNEADAIAAITGPMDDLVKDMEKVKAPSDLKDYHRKSVAAFKTAAEKLKKDKDISALGDAQIPDAPAGASERLDKLARENEDCKSAGVVF
jgi:hypothetical protein